MIMAGFITILSSCSLIHITESHYHHYVELLKKTHAKKVMNKRINASWVNSFDLGIMTFILVHVSHSCPCVFGPLARYVKLLVAHAPGMPGRFFPSPRVSDPDMRHGTCVTHVPWWMLGSLLAASSFEVGDGEPATRGFTYLVRDPCVWWLYHHVLSVH